MRARETAERGWHGVSLLRNKSIARVKLSILLLYLSSWFSRLQHDEGITPCVRADEQTAACRAFRLTRRIVEITKENYEYRGVLMSQPTQSSKNRPLDVQKSPIGVVGVKGSNLQRISATKAFVVVSASCVSPSLTPLSPPHMRAVCAKSSETRAILLLISSVAEHLQATLLSFLIEALYRCRATASSPETIKPSRIFDKNWKSSLLSDANSTSLISR